MKIRSTCMRISVEGGFSCEEKAGAGWLGSKIRNEIGARFVRTRGEMFGRSGGRKKPMNN